MAIRKFILATDTGCDLAFDWLEAQTIRLVGMPLAMDDQEVDTAQEVDLVKFYTDLKNGVEAKTAAVSVGKYVEFFRELVGEGLPVLYVGLSSGLSSTLENARQALTILHEDLPGADVRIFDSLNGASGEGLVTYLAWQLREEGLVIDEAIAKLSEIVLRVNGFYTVDDLWHLVKGGRLSKTAAFVGTALNIKPILDVTPSGELRVVARVRGRKKSVSELATRILADLEDSATVMIVSSGDVTDAEGLRDKVLQDARVKEVIMNQLGPTIGTHTGTGALGVFALGKQVRE
ncbi:MAG: DegV family protein [Streptococcaceae bacterium]|jgi:DegV family protein with EDD domain|nr:DegV family protein [Streptococcaceae bacterium]